MKPKPQRSRASAERFLMPAPAPRCVGRAQTRGSRPPCSWTLRNTVRLTLPKGMETRPSFSLRSTSNIVSERNTCILPLSISLIIASSGGLPPRSRSPRPRMPTACRVACPCACCRWSASRWRTWSDAPCVVHRSHALGLDAVPVLVEECRDGSAHVLIRATRQARRTYGRSPSNKFVR